jgi:prevent-host-death family protein
MTRKPNIIPITDLRQDATSIVNRVSAGEEPVVITQRGRAAAVMVSIQAYERSHATWSFCGFSLVGKRRSRQARGMTSTRCSRRRTPC